MSEFKVDSIERLFRRLLAEAADKHLLIDFRVYPSFEDSEANCKCRSDINFQVWNNLFEEQRFKPISEAELISYGGSSVMLYRDASGAIQRRLLGGSDPAVISSQSCSAELLYVHPSPSTDGPRRNRPDATFFLRSAKVPTEQCARQMGEELLRRTHLDALDLYIRSDAWFLEWEEFPIIYPYEKPADPPSEAAYRSSREAGCSIVDSKFSCWAK